MQPLKIIAYPLRLENGGVALSADPGAELDLLLEYPLNCRSIDKTYGIGINHLMQMSTDANKLVPLALVEIREKLLKFAKNTQLVSVNIFKERTKPRTIFLKVMYQTSTSNIDKITKIFDE